MEIGNSEEYRMVDPAHQEILGEINLLRREIEQLMRELRSISEVRNTPMYQYTVPSEQSTGLSAVSFGGQWSTGTPGHQVISRAIEGPAEELPQETEEQIRRYNNLISGLWANSRTEETRRPGWDS